MVFINLPSTGFTRGFHKPPTTMREGASFLERAKYLLSPTGLRETWGEAGKMMGRGREEEARKQQALTGRPLTPTTPLRTIGRGLERGREAFVSRMPEALRGIAGIASSMLTAVPTIPFPEMGVGMREERLKRPLTSREEMGVKAESLLGAETVGLGKGLEPAGGYIRSKIPAKVLPWEVSPRGTLAKWGGREAPGVAPKPGVRPAPVSPTREAVAPEETSIQKVITALKEAKPLRKGQEALYRKERGQRISRALAAGEKVAGERGFYAELRALGGKMPKVQYESLRGKIGQADIDDLFIKIKESPLLNEWDKIPARKGLAKIFGEFGGGVPTENELSLLHKTFGSEFTRAVVEKKPLLEKLSGAAYQLVNIPRSLMASTDMSAPFRQGAFLVGRPKQFLSAFKEQFKYFFNEKAFKASQAEIVSRPSFKLMKEFKLALTDLDSVLTAREERFMSYWAENIPVIGRVVRASARAYTGFLNKLRADVFDDLVGSAKNLGLAPEENSKLLKDLAGFINAATGRGSLGSLEKAALPLNSFFFSPRLAASRITLLNPIYYVKLDPFVRKEALKSLFTFAGAGLTTLQLAKAGGAEIGTDPRSADFGKIKIGNTRVDLWGGFQQYIRLVGQLTSGKIVSSTTGKEYTLGEGYRPLTRYDIAMRFAEYKEAPVFSFATELLRGQTVFGEEPKWGEEIANRFIPMVTQDIFDLYKEWGPGKLPLAVLPWFGVGLQTYGPRRTPTPTRKPTAVPFRMPSYLRP